MKVLVVGGGAREHALVWRLASNPLISTVYCAPGNAGTAALANSVPIRHDDVETLAEWALKERIDLTLIGPEGPLALGVVDQFAERGLVCVGPTRDAARIETSKGWAKDLMLRHGIPTAQATVVSSVSDGLDAARRAGFPVVVKADGLAAGKGVAICRSEDEVRRALGELIERRALGDAGERVLIEEHLLGEELSVLAFCDGHDLAVMPAARDYKRVGEGDTGPNTGGMGAYAPVPAADQALLRDVYDRILTPTVAALADAGSPFKGVLYAGLMLTADGPKVLEFNCRFGDPEAQALMPLLDTELLTILQAIANGELGRLRIAWTTGATCVVVAASAGYPGGFRVGIPIRGLDSVEGGLVFQGGTRFDPNGRHVVTAGGRVLSVVGRGRDVAEARAQAYGAITTIGFEGMQYRPDIGANVLAGRAASAPDAALPLTEPGPAAHAALAPLSGQPDTSPRLAATGAPATIAAAGPSEARPVRVPATAGTARVGVVGAAAPDQALIGAIRARCAMAGLDTAEALADPRAAGDALRGWLDSAAERGVRLVIAIGASVPQLPGLVASMTDLPVLGVMQPDEHASAWEVLAAIHDLPAGVPLALAGIGEQGARNAAALALAILAQTERGLTGGAAEQRHAEVGR